MRSVTSSPGESNPFRLSLRQWLIIAAIFASLAVTTVMVTRAAMAEAASIEQRIASLELEEKQLKKRIGDADLELRDKRAQLEQVNSELNAYAKRDTAQGRATPPENLPESTEARELVSLFGGPDRRAASDKLLELHASGKRDEVVEALLGAIVPKGAANSYRVNLYILYTLARIRPTWEGSQEQVRAVEELAGWAPYYNDQTYAAWAKKAVSQARVR